MSLVRRLGAELYRIRYRLLLVNTLVVAVPLLGIAFARFYERAMLQRLEQDMIHQGQALGYALLDDPTGLRLAERQPLLGRTARATGMRLRLLDAAGAAVADSDPGGAAEGPNEPTGRTSYESMSGDGADVPVLADRREVKVALQGRYGAASRLQGGRIYLESALPIQKDGRVVGVVYVTRSTAPVKLTMFRLRATLFRVLLAALAVTAVLSLFLAATIARPLARLTRTAARIAAGERGLSLASDRRDEIGDLARAFDEMARRLDERAAYVGELAANVSHEFKSPLTSIRGAAELLLDGAADDPAARARFLRNILGDCQRLDRLVTRLLELSRLESDGAPFEQIDYLALVRDAAGDAALDYGAGTTRLRGRRAHLGSALANLLDNARRHADAGTPVSVRVSDEGGRVRTAVHNQGGPISAANLPRVWDRFFTTRADRGGTGLGLAIVVSVVRAHGGAVGVTSDDGGTTFWYDLPAG